MPTGRAGRDGHERADGGIDLRCGPARALAAAAGVLGEVDAGVDRLAVFLGEATPYAVRLTGTDGVVGALDAHGAARAYGLGGHVTRAAGGAALVLGVEEECRIGGAA